MNRRNISKNAESTNIFHDNLIFLRRKLPFSMSSKLSSSLLLTENSVNNNIFKDAPKKTRM